jgi:copper homeostasis protein
MIYKLEVIGFNISSCIKAQLYGAHRIELCDNPSEGGTTPSAGFIEGARKKLQIELNVMIRPRGGDFLYTDEEFEIMKKDVMICKQSGCDGIVTGMLTADGEVNKRQLSKIVEAAYPLSVTFHRAFDHAMNPFQAMEEIIAAGCSTILTSGQMPDAMEGATLIEQLVRQADDRIIIMPGSGVRASNIRSLATKTRAREFHSSARKQVESRMNYFNPNMKEIHSAYGVDKLEVRTMVDELNHLFRNQHED